MGRWKALIVRAARPGRAGRRQLHRAGPGHRLRAYRRPGRGRDRGRPTARRLGDHLPHLAAGVRRRSGGGAGDPGRRPLDRRRAGGGPAAEARLPGGCAVGGRAGPGGAGRAAKQHLGLGAAAQLPGDHQAGHRRRVVRAGHGPDRLGMGLLAEQLGNVVPARPRGLARTRLPPRPCRAGRGASWPRAAGRAARPAGRPRPPWTART
jgi:hypothetical protein